MKCPKCELGFLQKIRFQKTNTLAYLCDTCGVFWYDNETIAATSGHTLVEENGVSLVYEYLSEKDKEDQAAADEKDRISSRM